MHRSGEVTSFLQSAPSHEEHEAQGAVLRETVSITKDETSIAADPKTAITEPESPAPVETGSLDVLAPLTLIGFTMLLSTLAAAFEFCWLSTPARLAWCGALGNCVVLFVWLLSAMMGYEAIFSLIQCAAAFGRTALGIVVGAALGRRLGRR